MKIEIISVWASPNAEGLFVVKFFYTLDRHKSEVSRLVNAKDELDAAAIIIRNYRAGPRYEHLPLR